ncbi:hypothetical protein [Rhodococcus opacus]|uniref:hypothetical protein n=1 Tax=Rhodococcus opacus TaxID=37919 RepID=UPI0024BB33DF|nr:hypothetical protein [Rhodococcus opacus]MDJ0413818.1 hypothetical protein [Rhodococcus opacus]
MSTVETAQQKAEKAAQAAAAAQAELDALTTARDERMAAAELKHAHHEYANVRTPLLTERDEADEEWATISADPTKGIPELWQSYQRRRIAHARLHAQSTQAAGHLHRIDPLPRNRIGVDVVRPSSVDATEGWTFLHALNDVDHIRITGAADNERQRYTSDLAAVIDHAAKG